MGAGRRKRGRRMDEEVGKGKRGKGDREEQGS